MGQRILVVDDEKNIRLMLEQALVVSGYEVNTAPDGETALEQARETHPDMILLDMKLPGIDGLEVLRQLRGIQPDVPVVMITAHGTVETAVEAMKLGAIDYLRKPFVPDEIRSVVAKVLSRQAIATDKPAQTPAEALEQAKLLLTQRHFTQARRVLHQASALDPANAETLNLLGVCYELQGHVQEAARFFRAALSFDPSYTASQQNLVRVTRWNYTPEGVEEDLRPGAEVK